MTPRPRPAFAPTLAFAATLALAALGCAPTGAGGETESGRAAIVGGEPTEGDPAVVMLVSYPPDHATFETCTASLIAEGVLLTAAHCVDPATHPGHGFGVFTGPDASAFTTANTLIPQLVPIEEALIHPDYDPAPPFHADIAVALVDGLLDVAPLPLHRDPLGPEIVGRPARIVGYGQIKYKEYNALKHEAATTIAALDEGDTLTVGDQDHRSCVGDSGGPALVVMDGVERIVGVDSYTDLAGCLDPAHYRRPDLYTAFLDLYAPPSGAGGEGGAPSTIDTAGEGGAPTSGSSGGCSIAPFPGAPASGSTSPRAPWLPLLLAAAALCRPARATSASRR